MAMLRPYWLRHAWAESYNWGGFEGNEATKFLLQEIRPSTHMNDGLATKFHEQGYLFPGVVGRGAGSGAGD